MICLTIIAIFPFYYMAVTALKTEQEYVWNKFGLPMHAVLSNLLSPAFGSLVLAKWFVNSLLLTTGSVVLTLLCSVLGAFALTFMQFRLRAVLSRMIMPLMAVPPIVMIIPLFVLMVNIGVINTRVAPVLVYVGLLLPFSIYLLSSFFRTIPREIVDAAVVDGATSLQVLTRIVVPLARPPLITLSVVNALFVWNELLVAMVFIQSDELRTLMVGLSLFKSRWDVNVPSMMAGLVVASWPVIILYGLGQRHFIRGMVGGSLKE